MASSTSTPMASSSSVFSATGSCLCKTVQFTISSEPGTRYLCHCPSCKKSSGSAFMHNWGFPQEVVTYTAGAEYVKTYADPNTNTGTPLERSFCSICGSPVAIHTGIQPGRVFIPSGTLDDKVLQSQVPLLENFVEDRVTWIGQVAAKQMSGSKQR